MGVSPLIHLSPSQNHRHPGLRRAGAGALKRRHHVREMETFHVVNPWGCQRNPNERGSFWGWWGAPRTGLGEKLKGYSGRQEPGPLPSCLTLSAPFPSLEMKQTCFPRVLLSAVIPPIPPFWPFLLLARSTCFAQVKTVLLTISYNHHPTPRAFIAFT